MTITQKSPLSQVDKLVLDGSPLLPQLIDKLDKRAHLAGKHAYDFLAAVREKSASDIQSHLSCMGLATIATRDLGSPIEAALAVASAALLDSTRGLRLTGAERIDRALQLLDVELSAGW